MKTTAISQRRRALLLAAGASLIAPLAQAQAGEDIVIGGSRNDTIAGNGGKFLAGTKLSYPDLSLFQIVAGMRYAFPRAMVRLEKNLLRVKELHDAVAARPRIKAYLASKRRIPFNRQGIFRNYPELDP